MSYVVGWLDTVSCVLAVGSCAGTVACVVGWLDALSLCVIRGLVSRHSAICGWLVALSLCVNRGLVSRHSAVIRLEKYYVSPNIITDYERVRLVIHYVSVCPRSSFSFYDL